MTDGLDILHTLWREVFGEPPSISSEPQLLVRVLVEALPPAPPYRLGVAGDAPRPAAGVYPSRRPV